MEIYERIAYLRKEKLHISRREFGERLGVSESVIVNIEYNRLQRPDQKEPLYKLICKEFHVSYIWLTEGIEPMYTDLNADTMSRIDDIMTGENEFAKNLFKKFANLGDSEWELLEQIIKNLAEEME